MNSRQSFLSSFSLNVYEVADGVWIELQETRAGQDVQQVNKTVLSTNPA